MQKRNRFCIFLYLMCDLLTTLNILPWWLMYVVKHSFLALYFAVPDKINTFVLALYFAVPDKINTFVLCFS